MAMAEMGASLAVHHHLAHDIAQYGSADDLDRLIEQLSEAAPATGRVVALAGDLADPWASEELVAAATDSLGHLDIVVCNHAHGGDPYRSAMPPQRPMTDTGQSTLGQRSW